MILQSFKMALASIMSNKMRSFLTMLGIIIGVMALVVLVSLVNSTTQSVTSSISDISSDYLMVTISDDKGDPLKVDDVAAFMDEDAIEAAAPVSQSSVTASSSTAEEDSVTVYGTTAAYELIMDIELSSGRWIKTTDVDNHTNVVIINSGLATDVMGRTDVEGETINLGGVDYLIVGVIAEDDSDDTTTETYEAYIPYTSLIRLVDDVSSNITAFYVSAAEDYTVDDAEEVMTDLLLERLSDDEDAFSIVSTSVIEEALESVTSTLSLLLGGIAAISLLVGGIGIMNIMLVSVTERTREIGIRKAIGAGRGTIMLQFLIEALVVSLMGCIIGILLSWVTIQIVNVVGGVSFTVSGGVVVVSIVFSLVIGVVFGLYPANKAASKRPIDALRYTG